MLPAPRSTTFVLSANIHRRHMTKGQRAMAVAGVVSVSDTPVTRSIREDLAKEAGVGQNRIAIALMIYEAASDLADNVLSGSSPLDETRSGVRTARSRLWWHSGESSGRRSRRSGPLAKPQP